MRALASDSGQPFTMRHDTWKDCEMPDRSEEFISLFAANQRRIYGFVATMVPRASDVDDVFQEVSMNLWRNFDEFESGTNFAAWAFSFARFGVLKYYDKQSRSDRFVFDSAACS